jgi:hypothetical protein
VFVELFCKGSNSSFEGCCFRGGLAVGLAQGHLFQGNLVHLSRQVVELVDNCLEGIFEELVLAFTESNDSLFDVVEALLVLVVVVVVVVVYSLIVCNLSGYDDENR